MSEHSPTSSVSAPNVPASEKYCHAIVNNGRHVCRLAKGHDGEHRAMMNVDSFVSHTASFAGTPEQTDATPSASLPVPAEVTTPLIEQRKGADGVRLVRTRMPDRVVLADIAHAITKHDLTIAELRAVLDEHEGRSSSDPAVTTDAGPVSEVEIDGRRYIRNPWIGTVYPNQRWLRVDERGQYHAAHADAWLDRIADLESRLARSASTPAVDAGTTEGTRRSGYLRVGDVPDVPVTITMTGGTAIEYYADLSPEPQTRTPEAVKAAWGDVEELAIDAGVDSALWITAVARFWKVAGLASEPVEGIDNDDEAALIASLEAVVRTARWHAENEMTDHDDAVLLQRDCDTAEAFATSLRAARSPAVDDETVSVDWTEDFAHENGRYIGKCLSCGREFTGHKRRLTCKRCAARRSPESTQEANHA